MTPFPPTPNLADLNKLAKLAAKILSDPQIKYCSDKEQIQSVFGWSTNYSKKIMLRLAVIDGFYSTQMNRRLFGLEEVEMELQRAGANNDETFANAAAGFIHAPSNESCVLKLLQKNYGRNKKGDDRRKAASLITKYLYYVTEFKFPIYDNLVRDSYNRILKMCNGVQLQKMKDECDVQFFKNLIELKSLSRIDTFDSLDNLLWILGKIRKGSLSAIVPNDTYKQILGKKGVPKGRGATSKRIDDAVARLLRKEGMHQEFARLLGDDFMTLVEFTGKLPQRKSRRKHANRKKA